MTGTRVSALAYALRRGTRSAVPYLTTAALVVVTAAVALVAIGPRQPRREDEATHLPSLIRALHATSGDVDDELLIETVFTPDMLPVGDAEPIFYRITLPPGTSLPALVGSLSRSLCLGQIVASGIGLEIVQSGTYSLRLETPIQVQRAGSSGVAEAIAAEQDVLLGPGDAAIYADYAGAGTIRNAGETPVVVIGMAVGRLEGTGSDLPQLPEDVAVELLANSLTASWETLPPGPVAVSLWRLRLPAGTTVGPYAGSRLEALSVERGSISRRYYRLAAQTPEFPRLIQYPGEQSIFLAPAPGIRRSITSGDTDPAVLLAASIEPEAIWSATLAP